jgi:hypothetical protein
MTYKSLIYTKEEIFVSHTIQKPKNINGAKYAPFLKISLAERAGMAVP